MNEVILGKIRAPFPKKEIAYLLCLFILNQMSNTRSMCHKATYLSTCKAQRCVLKFGARAVFQQQLPTLMSMGWVLLLACWVLSRSP